MATLTIPAAKTRSKQHDNVEKLLKSKRDELRRKLNHRFGDVSVEREPDDEGALATSNFAKDLAIATIERERRDLAEIEAALARIKAGEYGVCETCESPIREVRLQALPWARLCIRCADRGPDLALAGD
ncbi:MAG TPA: TraR/DksA C4-type zinc finger protein [Candidatus Acidoferrales bacterium]|nr:TraR/DksA C4-type zinc finger protein [Candidatus Acidoferrales bacterium]